MLRTIPQFGTDPDLFHPPETHPERPFTIGYIGRLVEEKRRSASLAGCCEITRQLASAAGGQWPLKRNAHAAGENPQYHRKNHLDKMGGLYRNAGTVITNLHVMVLPSLTRPNWKEQFGRVLVEAMASGVTLIGSDSGAIPGVIGEGGLIFKEGDVDDLSAKLQSLLDNPEQRKTLARKWASARVKIFHT